MHVCNYRNTYADNMTDGDHQADYKGRDAFAVWFRGIARTANHQDQDQREEELYTESLDRGDSVRELYYT